MSFTPAVPAVLAYLRDLCSRLERNWQKLPLHEGFKTAHPIPLPTIAKCYESGRENGQRDHRYGSPWEAADAVLANQSVVLLFGDPGAGKTTATKWIAHQAGQRWLSLLENKDGAAGVLPAGLSYLPIYVDLGAYDRAGALHLITEDALKDVPLAATDARKLWILDGLDVLASFDRISMPQVFRDARRVARDTGDRYLFAGRPMEQAIRHFDDGKAHILLLQRLTHDLAEAWIDRTTLADARAAYDRFRRDHPHAASFLHVPLLFAMALSAALDQNQTGRPFDASRYSGRAGMFHGFVTYALQRRDIEPGKGYRQDVADGVFYHAIMDGREDRFPSARVAHYLHQAEDVLSEHDHQAAWEQTAQKLEHAGILTRHAGEIRALHQQFAEYFAACHLARRLEIAAKHDWLEAELWDHLIDARLDPVVGQAVALAVAQSASYDICGRLIATLGPEYAEGQLSILQHVGRPAALHPLCDLLSTDVNIYYRDRAAEILREMHPVELTDRLLAILSDRSISWRARQYTAKAVRELEDPRVFRALYRMLREAIEERSRPQLLLYVAESFREHAQRNSVQISNLRQFIDDLSIHNAEAIFAKPKGTGDKRVVPPSMHMVLGAQRVRRDRAKKGAAPVTNINNPTFINSIVNIDSSLDHAIQTVQARPQGDEAAAVLDQLKEALKEAAAQGKPQEAQAAAELAEELAKQSQNPAAKPSVLNATKEGLLKAADALAAVVERVLPLAQKLAGLLVG